jgi:hypothetical protein
VTNSRGVKWTGHIICIGEMINVYRILETEPQREVSLGLGGECNIKMELK